MRFYPLLPFLLLSLLPPGFCQAQDLSLNRILLPAQGCGWDGSQSISVEIENAGTTVIDSSRLELILDGTSLAVEFLDALILPGEVREYTFGTTADLSGFSSYEIEAVGSAWPLDLSALNDTASLSAVHDAPIFGGFHLDYDSFATTSFTLTFMENSTEDVLDWEGNSGPTLSIATGPNSDFSGTGNYIYMESSLPGVAGDSAVLLSDCYFVAAGTYPGFRMAYHMFGEAIGSLRVEVLTGDSTSTEALLLGQQQALLWSHGVGFWWTLRTTSVNPCGFG